MRSNDLSRPPAARRFVRMVSALCLGAAGLGVTGVAGVALTAAEAGASTTTASSPTTLTGTQDLQSTGVSATGGGVTATFDLVETLGWSQPAQISTSYATNQIRQGRSPAPKTSYARTGAGTMSVSWTLDNLKVAFGNYGAIGLGSPSVSASAPCNLAASAAPYACTLDGGTTALVSTPYGYHGPYVDLGLKADVTVTPQELASLRTLVDAGTAGTPVHLMIGETPVADTFSLPCSDGAGGDIGYDLGPLSATDGVSVLNDLAFDVGAAAPSATSGVEALVQDAHPTISLSPLAGSLAMSGPGTAIDLGHLLANDVPPKVSAGGPYTGTAGIPVAFSASGTKDVCGFPKLMWNFSDGGVANGMTPLHSFGSAGLYGVRLTATDATGLTSSTTLTVPVAARKPVVAAGSDQATEWGLPVPFSGIATETGTAPPSLADSWTFGDGSGANGTSVTHEYATPNVYTATFTSCDPSAACTASTTHVRVTKRGTTTAYTGATASDVGRSATYAASVLDDLGDPVPGGVVDFYADDSSTPFTSAVANSMGFAFATSPFPRGSLGNHTVTARYGGDSLYTGSSYGPVPYTVNPAPAPANPGGSAAGTTASPQASTTKLGTAIAYTGATASDVTGKVIYAASVLDDLGDPVAGGVVDFYADNSSRPFTSAVTNSMGFAFATSVFGRGTVGSHMVTARYAGDSHYTGSSYGPLPYTVNPDGSSQVTISKRGTTIAYTGATASDVTGTVIYAASVLDDLGDPVADGIVEFYADGSSTPFAIAVTNSYGFAFATSTFPGGTVSIHTVTARYAGDSRYTASSYGPVPYTMND